MILEALEIADKGYRIFPITAGRKFPPLIQAWQVNASSNQAQIKEWWEQWPSANIALLTDGLLVVDVDALPDPSTGETKQIPNQWPGAERGTDLAIAPLSATPSKGRHYIFCQPQGHPLRNTAGHLAQGVDTRANGGYIVVPPSQIAGEPYRWPSEELPPMKELPEPPSWLLEELRQEAPSGVALQPGEGLGVIPRGQRHDALLSIAGVVRNYGFDEHDILKTLLAINEHHCEAWQEQVADVHLIAASAAAWEPIDAFVSSVSGLPCPVSEVLPEATPSAHNEDPGAIDPRLMRLPGLIGQVTDHVMRVSTYPNLPLALGGALALQAHLAARKIVGPTGLGTNMYVINLARSGTGKDTSRKVNKEILSAAGIEGVGNSMSSRAGVEESIITHPAMLYQTDEFTGLIKAMSDPRSTHGQAIQDILLDLYTSSGSSYETRAVSSRQPEAIQRPHLSILGTAVPEHFYQALTEEMLSNGFLSRSLIIEAQSRGRGAIKEHTPIPPGIVDRAKQWAALGASGNLGPPEARTIRFSEEARAVAEELQSWADDQYAEAEARKKPTEYTAWSRVTEQAIRLATLYACSIDPLIQSMPAEAMEWGRDFAVHQLRRMLFMSSAYSSVDDIDALAKRMHAFVMQKGGRVSRSMLTSAHRGDPRKRDQAIKSLIDSNELRVDTVATPSGKRGPSQTQYSIPIYD